jgi:protein associated with RNAse G/E
VVQPGVVVDVRFTKWGGGRHWEFPVTVLGTDEHGVWGGAGVGTRLWRPAASFVSEFDWVTVFPHEAAWAASFYDSEDQPVAVYVDMTTPAVWTGSTVTMVDLDLDVVLARDGSLFLDDEDEFEAHRVALGYPREVVTMARRAAGEVMAAVQDGAEPFDALGPGWLERWRTAVVR